MLAMAEVTPDFQDSIIHKELLFKAKQLRKRHIIENKIPPEKIGKLLYKVHRPNSCTAVRRVLKREHFSNKAIG